ncbi:MAG: hypothetical protein ACI9G1_002681 [Pirellulaceae bacterium]|jgi:hypothetical protein
MWVRKTDKQLHEVDRRQKIVNYGAGRWIVALAVFVMIVLVVFQESWREDHGLQNIVFWAFVFLAVSTFVYYLSREVLLDMGSNAVLPELHCDRCHKVKPHDNNFDCECGGWFEPNAYWEWVAPEESKPRRRSRADRWRTPRE